MNREATVEPQYNFLLDLRDRKGLSPLGLMMNQVWNDDPRRLLFVLARYKFVAKMLADKGRVLEVGCGDAFATRMVLQEVGEVLAVDFDPVFVRDVERRMDLDWPFECRVHDILNGPVLGPFDAAYSLDVLEHIRREDEDAFMRHVAGSLEPHGEFIVGMPSIQSQAYASPQSKEGHVNCKDGAELRKLMLKHYHHAFLFSMNDEVVHTGFHPMAHYLLCIGAEPRREQHA